MIPKVPKEIIWLGTASDCDVRVLGAGVKPKHARISRSADGQLMLLPASSGVITIAGQPVPKTGAPFDFRSPIALAGTEVPLAHPGLTALLIHRGKLPAKTGTLTFGRDPARCHVVLTHANISGEHATFTQNPTTVVDHASTAGTWVNRKQVASGATTALDPSTTVHLGPVPITPVLLQQLFAAEAESAGASAATSDRPKHRTVLGQVSLQQNAKPSLTIGRTPNNDIQVDHAQVSSQHAVLHRSGGKLFLEDRGSANGTYVRGQRIPTGQQIAIQPGEKVFVGPMPLRLHAESQANDVALVVEDQQGWAGRPLYEIEALDLFLQVPDRDNPRELKTLLERVTFKAMPGDFIALMGPSGAGKTTLLLTLNGYLPPTSGQVRINGEDLYSIYDALRGSIGYVPQDDIVHPELTVWEAVRYSAKFRLPPDYSSEEIDRRVATTLEQLGLEGVSHLQIGKPENKILSGGQRKRVNIAMELVTDPVIMFLDEPTSGLAADDTTALVSLLQNLASSTGKTIVTTIHQPAKDEFEKFNLCLIMGPGGIPMYYGPTAPDAYQFFGSQKTRDGEVNDVDNPRDMFAMLPAREEQLEKASRAGPDNLSRFALRQRAAKLWAQEFFNEQNATFRKMFHGKRAVGTSAGGQSLPSGRPKTRGQFSLLIGRYAKIKFRDAAGTWIMLLQAPVIGALLALVFGGQERAIPFWCLGALQELSNKTQEETLGEDTAELLKNMQPTVDHAPAIFFVVVAAVWFGTSNAAREIVSERAVYLRERMVNLGLFNYLFSKFVFLSLVGAAQCAALLAIVFFTLGFHGGPEAFLYQLGYLTITAMNSTALGLVLSTVVISSEAAMALTPIALIPQVVLGGLMVPMTTNPILEWGMHVMPARWGFQGMVAKERMAIVADPSWVIDLKRPKLNAPEYFIEAGRFRCAEAQMAADNLTGAWGFTQHATEWLPFAVQGGMMSALLLCILVLLRKRDRI